MIYRPRRGRIFIDPEGATPKRSNVYRKINGQNVRPQRGRTNPLNKIAYKH